MDDNQDQDIELLRDQPQRFDAKLSICRRQPRSWLIAEQERCLVGHPTGQGHTSALAAGDAPHLGAANVGLSHGAKAEGLNQEVDHSRTVPAWLLLKGCIESNGLADPPMRWHHIFLRNVGRDAPEEPRVAGVTVDEYLTRVGRCLLHGEHVQQSALATAAWTHQGHKLAGLQVARARLKDGFLLPTRQGHREPQVSKGQAGSRKGEGRLVNLHICSWEQIAVLIDGLLLQCRTWASGRQSHRERSHGPGD
mmetsp:Transcript_19415/g.51887  ORF Transcript_19415/g.51887 Transcript_19415/m.51887 type:complete len:251 (+) Transcript_19415:1547-2299(+)